MPYLIVSVTSFAVNQDTRHQVSTEVVTTPELLDAFATGRSGDSGLPLPYLLLRAPQAAALLNTSVRTWRMWNATGKIPRPMHIGRGVYWPPDELKAWIAAGCPDRVTWEIIRQS
jgi:predicted DNA-binding transcriptional regulator AlpA